MRQFILDRLILSVLLSLRFCSSSAVPVLAWRSEEQQRLPDQTRPRKVLFYLDRFIRFILRHGRARNHLRLIFPHEFLAHTAKGVAATIFWHRGRYASKSQPEAHHDHALVLTVHEAADAPHWKQLVHQPYFNAQREKCFLDPDRRLFVEFPAWNWNAYPTAFGRNSHQRRNHHGIYRRISETHQSVIRSHE